MRATLMLLTFNQEHFVRDAVLSALAQDCEPIDILISDDASSDGTACIVQNVIAEYSGPHRVRFNQNACNLGIAFHINHCLKLIETDIVVAAAGDDVSNPDRVARILCRFRSTGALLVHSRVTYVGSDGEPLDNFLQSDVLFMRTNSLALAAVHMALYIGATGAWHRDLFERYGDFRDPECFEDLIVGFRAALEGRIAFIDDALVRYRIGNGVSTADVINSQGASPRQLRVKFLQRKRHVLEHRLSDCILSKNPQRIEIMRLLQRELGRTRLMLATHETHAALFLARHILHLPAAIRALSSERRRLRKLRS